MKLGIDLGTNWLYRLLFYFFHICSVQIENGNKELFSSKRSVNFLRFSLVGGSGSASPKDNPGTASLQNIIDVAVFSAVCLQTNNCESIQRRPWRTFCAPVVRIPFLISKNVVCSRRLEKPKDTGTETNIIRREYYRRRRR